jgi:DNA-directed RNA polymerase subunit beta
LSLPAFVQTAKAFFTTAVQAAFDNPVTVGYIYFLKLHHLVDDKIHASRQVLILSLLSNRLVKKPNSAGSACEMEVWGA